MKLIFLIISIAVPVGLFVAGLWYMVKEVKEIMRVDPWSETHEDI